MLPACRSLTSTREKTYERKIIPNPKLAFPLLLALRAGGVLFCICIHLPAHKPVCRHAATQCSVAVCVPVAGCWQSVTFFPRVLR